MRTDCIVKLSKLQISELNTLVQKETSGDVEGNHLLRTVRSLVVNAINVVASVGVNCRLQFNSARKAIKVQVLAGNN
jgi:hypothetical protein